MGLLVKINYLADWREGIFPELWSNGSPLYTVVEPSLSFSIEDGMCLVWWEASVSCRLLDTLKVLGQGAVGARKKGSFSWEVFHWTNVQLRLQTFSWVRAYITLGWRSWQRSHVLALFRRKFPGTHQGYDDFNPISFQTVIFHTVNVQETAFLVSHQL